MLYQAFFPITSAVTVGLQATSNPSLIEEIWDILYNRYFNIDLSRYENLGLGSGAIVSVPGMIFGLMIGIIIAAIIASFDKNRLGGFVRRLIKSECLSPERAKTLDELGYRGAKGLGIRGSLKFGTVLRRVVRCVERDQHEDDRKEALAAYVEKHGSEKGFEFPLFVLDFDTAHFYIPDEEHYAADTRFEQKGSGWRAMLLVLIVSSICLALAFFFLPEMLQMLDNMIGILKGQ